MPYLDFISDEKLIHCVMKVVHALENAERDAEKKIYSNAIDPFSAVFDAHLHGLTLNDWLTTETVRQIQKTMQNALGVFHQDILGSINGWQDLGVGGVIDLVNDNKRMIAEIKNKYNTTKGNHKVKIYDDIKGLLLTAEYKGYTGYYVEIIPKGKKAYDKPFVPSDNTVKDKQSKRRPENPCIRVIDGATFYDHASGKTGALRALYSVLPKVIQDQTGRSNQKIMDDPLFFGIYHETYT